MKFDPEKHHRRSIRLKGYDYAQSGAYFVTIVAQDRTCFFGDVADGEVRLNSAGCMVQTAWADLSIHYPGAECDAFVVMPNHIHGIIVLVGAGPRACPDDRPPATGQPRGVAPTDDPAMGLGQPPVGAGPCACPGVPTLSLPDVMHRFKTITTKQYAEGVKRSGWPVFRDRLWQRNYYEHVVRNEESLNRIRRYIVENPEHWAFDRENPEAVACEPEDARRD
ncbi:MAG: transposase [Deltaproteobacteria bacterium]|nr:transposase [Deltaproteobacteria bacterium]